MPKKVSGTVRIVVLPAAYTSIEFQTPFLGKALQGRGVGGEAGRRLIASPKVGSCGGDFTSSKSHSFLLTVLHVTELQPVRPPRLGHPNISMARRCIYLDDREVADAQDNVE